MSEFNLPDKELLLMQPCVLEKEKALVWLPDIGKPVSIERKLYMEREDCSYASLDGLYVHKVCGEKACINPDHLFLWGSPINPFKETTKKDDASSLIKSNPLKYLYLDYEYYTTGKIEYPKEEEVKTLKWPQTKGYRSI